MNDENFIEDYKVDMSDIYMWFTAGFIAVAFVVLIVAFIYKLFI